MAKVTNKKRNEEIVLQYLAEHPGTVLTLDKVMQICSMKYKVAASDLMRDLAARGLVELIRNKRPLEYRRKNEQAVSDATQAEEPGSSTLKGKLMVTIDMETGTVSLIRGNEIFTLSADEYDKLPFRSRH